MLIYKLDLHPTVKTVGFQSENIVRKTVPLSVILSMVQISKEDGLPGFLFA